MEEAVMLGCWCWCALVLGEEGKGVVDDVGGVAAEGDVIAAAVAGGGEEADDEGSWEARAA